MTTVEQERRGSLHNLDHTGDTVTQWDPTKPEEVAVARAVFDTLKKKGYLAYTVTDGDARGEVIREFDPKAGKIMMSPQPVGG
jgi:hypothetical protein